MNPEHITIPNINAPDSSTPHFIKRILLNFKTQTKYNSIIVGDFNISSPQEIYHLDKNKQRYIGIK